MSTIISTKKVYDKSVQHLLSLTTEYDIFSFYIEDFCLECNMHSPLRTNDRNPSFSIFKSQKGLKWRDFGTGKSGDFIEFIKEKFGLTFTQAIEKIYSDIIQIKGQSVPYYVFPGIQAKREIKVKKRAFNKFDLEYWKSYGINEQILKKYEVSSLQKYWLIEGNKEMVFNCSKNNSVYSYHYGSYIYRIYSPFNKEHKWITNAGSEILQGWNQLPIAGEKLILSKSLKDIMCLSSFNYTSCGPQSESTIIPENIISNLISRFKEIIVFFDNDQAGIEASKKYKSRYNFKTVFLPIESKDPSDLYKKYGRDFTGLTLKKLL